MGNQLASLSYMGGWSKLALHRLIWSLGQWVPCACPFLDPKTLSKFEKWKEEVPKFTLNFQNRLQNMMSYSSELLINGFLKRIKPTISSLFERLYGQLYCLWVIKWTTREREREIHLYDNHTKSMFCKHTFIQTNFEYLEYKWLCICTWIYILKTCSCELQQPRPILDQFASTRLTHTHWRKFAAPKSDKSKGVETRGMPTRACDSSSWHIIVMCKVSQRGMESWGFGPSLRRFSIKSLYVCHALGPILKFGWNFFKLLLSTKNFEKFLLFKIGFFIGLVILNLGWPSARIAWPHPP